MRVKLVVGDWSGDGHGKSEDVFFETNKTILEIQEAYKASCKLTGVEFNGNEDYTGLNRDWKIRKNYQIAVDYEEHEIPREAEELLLQHGIDVWEGFDNDSYDKVNELAPIDGVEHFAELWVKFVKLSLPDLEMEMVKDEVPSINGWWDKNLNVQFGYGLFD
jgi:hypothetical protein